MLEPPRDHVTLRDVVAVGSLAPGEDDGAGRIVVEAAKHRR
jgi:hypothetical protein